MRLGEVVPLDRNCGHKDLHVKVSSDSLPFLAVLAKLVRKGVCVRLLHAKEPGPIFREEFDRYPSLFTGLERALS